MKTLKTKFFLLSSILFSFYSWGQTCDCKTNFDWMKKTFEENDAGFQYVIDKKGKDPYELHNKEFETKVQQTKNLEECLDVLYDWMLFFRPSHIGIRNLQVNPASQTGVSVAAPVSNWETLSEKEISTFLKQIEKKKKADFEGVWVLDSYTIGIQKKENSYVGFIIETTAQTWKRGEVKTKFTENDGVFYMRDKSSTTLSEIKMLGNNYLQLGNQFLLKRLQPTFEDDKKFEHYFKTIKLYEPFLEEVDANTLLMRIPSFDESNKKMIDSIVNVNKEKILSTQNLIIDVRNNGGGSDGSFRELLPIIYTNPIRTVGVEMYSTKLNNQRMLDFVNNPKYGFSDEDKEWAKESYDKLEKSLGKFVNLNQFKVSEKRFDTIYKYPENVAILINKGNGSTTEQFLLAAKQSKKVKLFGVTTYGVLDISNMYFVPSPCKEFELGYCLSKSMRIPDMTIDGKGIQPDYYLDSDIPDYEWVTYTASILNENQSKKE